MKSESLRCLNTNRRLVNSNRLLVKARMQQWCHRHHGNSVATAVNPVPQPDMNFLNNATAGCSRSRGMHFHLHISVSFPTVERLFDESKCKAKKPQRIQSCKERSTKGSSKSEGWGQKQRKVAVLLAKVTVVWGLTAAGCTTLQAHLCTNVRAKKHHVWAAQKPMMQSGSHTPWHKFEAHSLQKNRMWKRNVGCQSKFS